MTNSAYVMGTLSWPMPDPGLVAVWRAMPIDGSQWDDWGDFEQGRHEGTVGALVDGAAGLDLDEHGAKLRAHVTDAALWQRLVIAWRAAADLGASGELVWCAAQRERAYRVTVGAYASQVEKLGAQAAAAIAVGELEPARSTPAPRPRAVTAKPVTAKPVAAAAKPATAKSTTTKPATAKPATAKPAKAKPAKAKAKAKPAKGKRRR